MEKLKVMVAGKDKRFRKKVKYLLKQTYDFELTGETEKSSETIVMANENLYNFLIVSEEVEGEYFIDVINKITSANPLIIILVVLEKYEKKKMKLALTAGAKEILEQVSLAATLSDALKRTYNRELILREEFQNNNGLSDSDRAKIVSFFSPRGGTGKTTISTNIAAILAKKFHKNVLLIDASIQFGDCALVLNIVPSYTIYELVIDINENKAVNLEEYLEKHHDGFKIIPAPIKTEYSEFIKPESLKKVINTFENSYDYIIIDCPSIIDDNTLVCLDKSDKICLISDVDLSAIKSVKFTLSLFASMKISRDKLHIILNKATEKLGIRYREMEEIFERPFIAKIPYDREVTVKAINSGEPVVDFKNKSKVAKEIEEIALKIML